jgi:hypothetical protein
LQKTFRENQMTNRTVWIVGGVIVALSAVAYVMYSGSPAGQDAAGTIMEAKRVISDGASTPPTLPGPQDGSTDTPTNQGDNASRDNASRDNASRDNASRDNASRDNASRDNASRDNAARDNAARDNAARDNAARDNAARDNAARDNAARDNAARDNSSNNN